METYGKILLIAIPAFVVLIIIEKLYGIWKKNDTVPLPDMISSLSSGITNVTKDVLGISVVILSYEWFLNHFTIVVLPSTFWMYAVAFLALDFSGYWVHRIAHEYNFFWNNHIIHHSSEEFNLACALRQSISVFVRIFTFFLLPAAFLGVPSSVIAVVAPLHLFAQFWYHTRHINRMGWLENIIVTPSHHRVHHAINQIYLDKNYGQIFIFWDKLFGTFQQELDKEPPVYGVTRPVQTWNPIKINFQHLWLLCKDAWRTHSWKDKFRIWFMPLGWRPLDVENKYPINKISDVFHYQKYQSHVSNIVVYFSLFQLLILLAMLLYLFGNIASIHAPGIYIFGSYVFLSVYAYTELLDGNPLAWIWELVKNGFGLFIWYFTGNWYGFTDLSPVISSVLMAYFLFSPVFVFLQCKKLKYLF